MKRFALPLVIVGVAVSLVLGFVVPNPVFWKSMEVTVTAYNSTPRQTEGNPSIAAWGDRLKPGMKCIAVSRDLIAHGLEHEVEVYIEGLEGAYRVLDKMNRRFEKRIDVYFGKNVEAARQFGEQQATIYWR
jgi:3D (Asp-Asp-Asp) domain-containing protein